MLQTRSPCTVSVQYCLTGAILTFDAQRLHCLDKLLMHFLIPYYSLFLS